MYLYIYIYIYIYIFYSPIKWRVVSKNIYLCLIIFLFYRIK
ncbi:MAG: hypothetical protein N7Q72_01320 [Spiroplasma sp. Tabriz.8]|nr:hypothetical protein [Spiroplasma sp. Tabriz.8]